MPKEYYGKKGGWYSCVVGCGEAWQTPEGRPVYTSEELRAKQEPTPREDGLRESWEQTLGYKYFKSHLSESDFLVFRGFISTLIEEEKEAERERVLEELADVPRATLTHPDGSQSVVILQHSLKTHGLTP